MTIHPHTNSSAGLDSLLPAWRYQRHELLRYLQSITLQPASSREYLEARIETCCQCLLDYLCMSHFLVFARVLHANRSSRVLSTMLQGIYRKIGYATDIALSFNDKYDTDATCLAEEPALHNDVRRVTRVMLMRFELEDVLVEIAREPSVNGSDGNAPAI